MSVGIRVVAALSMVCALVSLTARAEALPGWSCKGIPVTVTAGTTGADIIFGTPGDDVIQAGRGHDIIHGLGGDDIICGGQGHDRIYGGDGNDRIFGDRGNDEIRGGSGDDRLSGNQQNDTIYGDDGDDILRSGPGKRTLAVGGAGADDCTGVVIACEVGDPTLSKSKPVTISDRAPELTRIQQPEELITDSSAMLIFATSECSNVAYTVRTAGQEPTVHGIRDFPIADEPGHNCWHNHFARLGVWTAPLQADTVYEVDIEVVDQDGNKSRTTSRFRTKKAVDPPVVRSVSPVDVDEDSATLIVDTNECTNVSVTTTTSSETERVFSGAGYPAANVTNCKRRHVVPIGATEPLSAGTDYRSAVTVVDEDGHFALAEVDFSTQRSSAKPNALAPPTITTTATSASISFRTNECVNAQYRATDGGDTVQYSGDDFPVAESPGVNCWTEHFAELGVQTESLKPDTRYQLTIELRDADNEATVLDAMFTTKSAKPGPPVISNLVINPVTATTAEVTFKTDQCSNASYRATTGGHLPSVWLGPGFPTAMTRGVNCWFNHRAVLGLWNEDLVPNADYDLAISVFNGDGETASVSTRFRTEAPASLTPAPIKIETEPIVTHYDPSGWFAFEYFTNDVCGDGRVSIVESATGRSVGSWQGVDPRACYGPGHRAQPGRGGSTFSVLEVKPGTDYEVTVTVVGTPSDGQRPAGTGSDSRTFHVRTAGGTPVPPTPGTPIEIIGEPVIVENSTGTWFKYAYTTNDVCGNGDLTIVEEDTGRVVGAWFNSVLTTCWGPLHEASPGRPGSTFENFDIRPGTSYLVTVNVAGTPAAGDRVAGSGTDTRTFRVITPG